MNYRAYQKCYFLTAASSGYSPQVFKIPLDYTGPWTNPTFEMINVGASKLISIGIDYVNKWAFIGTDIGLALRYPLGDFSDRYDFFFASYGQITSIMMDNNHSIRSLGRDITLCLL
jgi:hypothetical protein